MGCSKRRDFSPTQPWRAETRLVPSKAAASEEARRTLRYVEPLSEARTTLAGFFSILLVLVHDGFKIRPANHLLIEQPLRSFEERGLSFSQ